MVELLGGLGLLFGGLRDAFGISEDDENGIHTSTLSNQARHLYCLRLQSW